ncbi:MAG: hypothetical protein GY913_06430 [Proteobacteria bacterium]|nr:hypothetical protein [Pseudomonadota bacterium]MCP4916542.1 hypothetical protein [Pseudomonadota bacterium]
MRGFEYAQRTLVRGGLVALGVVLLMGLGSALYGVTAVQQVVEPMGIDLRTPRILHTTFASAWIVLVGMSACVGWLGEQGPLGRGEKLALGGALTLFGAAGLGVLATVPLGLVSGREYLGFHPLLAVPILLGWLLLAGVFFRRALPGLFGRPVYVLMWAVGFVFFVVTFCEQYAWLLPEVFNDPIVDRRLQWKATGTLVGAVNLFVYGTALYLGEKLGTDPDVARSPRAFALFALGLLNSFTNFAHHTYHLPQSHTVKWIAFVVSMSEVLVLFVVLHGIVKQLSLSGGAARLLLVASKWWTAAIIASAVLLSIPPLNALVHGTWVVPGHAMGAMIGIDSMVLLAFVAWRLGETSPLRAHILLLNIALFGFVAWLHIAGLADGMARIDADPAAITAFAYRPAWLRTWLYPVLAVLGTGTALGLAALWWRWMPKAWSGRLSPGEPRS